MTRTLPLTFLIAALSFGAPCAQAQALDLDQIVTAEILPGWRDKGGTHIAALHLTLAPGWKTYWRVPGEAGIPPEFGWQGSGNLAALAVHWPLPEVFEINDLRSIGYHGEVVLPLTLTPVDPRQPVDLALTADLGVCDDICVPLSLSLTAHLGADVAAQDPAITKALASHPVSSAVADLSGLTCRVEPIADGLRVTADMVLPLNAAPETGVIELVGTEVWASLPTVSRNGGALRLTADLVPPDGAPFALDRSQLRLTILTQGHAVETLGCPAG